MGMFYCLNKTLFERLFFTTTCISFTFAVLFGSFVVFSFVLFACFSSFYVSYSTGVGKFSCSKCCKFYCY